MNEHMAQGKWQQLSGKIKQKWGKLTDDDLTRAEGDREYLVGKLHEQYGIAKDKAEDELETLGYTERDQDVDLRSSSRSSAGRMDLAGHSGGSSRKLQAGGPSDVDSQQNADHGSLSREGGESQEAADYEPAGHTLQAEPGQRSGSNAPQRGSRNPAEKAGSQQQKSRRDLPGSNR